MKSWKRVEIVCLLLKLGRTWQSKIVLKCSTGQYVQTVCYKCYLLTLQRRFEKQGVTEEKYDKTCICNVTMYQFTWLTVLELESEIRTVCGSEPLEYVQKMTEEEIKKIQEYVNSCEPCKPQSSTNTESTDRSCRPKFYCCVRLFVLHWFLCW